MTRKERDYYDPGVALHLYEVSDALSFSLSILLLQLNSNFILLYLSDGVACGGTGIHPNQ